MTETSDLLALRDGLPEGPWEQYAADALVVRAGKIWIANAWTVKIARAIAAIPSMLEEIERLRLVIENKNEACLLAIADVERLHGIITELREALAAMLDIYDHPHVEWQKQRVAAARMALIGREVENNEAFWEEARAILTKTETSP